MDDIKTDKATEKAIENANTTISEPSVAAEAPDRNTTFANRTFNAINYGGVNFLANSALSLGITYNVLPTKPAQKFIGGLANVLKPVVENWGKLKDKVGIKSNISAATRAFNIRESARSTAEILIMCIAGTIILLPMHFLEERKKPIIDKIDRIKNKKYHQYCKENGIEPDPLPYEEKDKKQGWKELLLARAAGIASVVGIDAVIQNFNNKRMAQGKGNFDTAEWKLGGKIYDKLPKSITQKFVNFFSMRSNADLSGIQKPMLERLRKTVGNDKSRMIFAEQTRFLSKEVSLTAVLSLIMFGLAKTGILSSTLNKLGFKKEKEQQQIVDKIIPDLPLVPITQGKIDLDGDGLVDSDKKHTDKIKPSSREVSFKPHESFTHKLADSSAIPQLSV